MNTRQAHLPPITGTEVATTSQRPGVPLVEEQVRDYRRTARARYEAERMGRSIANLGRSIVGRQPREHTLALLMNPETELRRSMHERARTVPAEVLYMTRRDNIHHRVYHYRSEERMLITGSDQQDRTFIMEDSYERLAQAELEYIHLGILQVRFQILHRRYAGTMALIVFRDTRWNTNDRSIIAAMEIDLAEGHQLIYVMPDIMLTIKDFFRHIQISIQTHGYESWEGAEANLLITRSITARLSNTPNIGFAFRVEKVAEYLRSKGVKAIDATKHSAIKFQGNQWNLRPSRVILPMQPSSLLSSTNYDGSTSIQFGGYQPAASSKAPLYNKEDDETDEEHIVGVITIIDDSLDDYPVLINTNDFLQDYPALAAFEDSLLQSMVGEESEEEEEISEEEAISKISEEEAISKILEETTISSTRSRYNINTALDDYPELQNIERILSTGESAISNYRPPQDEEMDIPGYAPAGSSKGWAGIEEANLAGKKPKKWENNSEWFQLPSANARRGSVFVMPYDFDPKEGIEVVSVGMNESDLSDIYSVSEGEDLTYQPEEFDIFMLQQNDIPQETLKIRRTHPLAFLPQRKTEGAAGYDLATCEGCVLTPHSHAILNTGISIKLPEGTYGRIAPRSGLSAKGIFINGGVIDADFRGSIQVILFNFSFENILFNIGDNIAQLIIEKIALPEVEEVQSLDQTQRGSRSFGSTDKQEERKVSTAFKPVPIPINMLQVIEDEPSEYLIGESEWRSQMRVSRKEYLCQHDWSYDEITAADCRDCKLEARAGNRIDCRKCKLTICSLCTYHCFKISWSNITRTQMKKTDWKSLSALQSNLIQKFIRRENELEEEVKNLRQQISGMEELAIIQEAPSEYERELTEVQQENAFLKLMNEKQQKEIEALKQEKQLLLELEEINKRELMDLKTRLLVPSSLPVLTFNEYYVNAAPQRNNLLNIKVRVEINNQDCVLNAILDTGAATCVCDGTKIPKEFRQQASVDALIQGVNGATKVSEILKEGKIWIGEQYFRLPRTFVMPSLAEGLNFILGMNFIRAMCLSGSNQKVCKVTKQPLSEAKANDRSEFADIISEVIGNMSVPVTVLNVTSMGAYRSDAHVGAWSYPPTILDCSHWCLPGVPDTWNELLFSYLPRKGELGSDSRA
ncbi:hypothetical protein ZIOFF_073063 [Zingiber officinale]|uniref:dUTP diphosphatase n=1 Tax=Zingiber officinale TaxID=94328 RepID=A0A8J5ETL7_ZINOF|nr:hypothetical protein ZIOFF_073063 [Zingiber officinale]